MSTEAVEQRLREAEQAISKLEDSMETLSDTVKENADRGRLNTDTLEKVADSIEELKRIVRGDADLGVPSLRSQVNELTLWKKRLEWTIYVLATISGGTLLGAIRLLFFP